MRVLSDPGCKEQRAIARRGGSGPHGDGAAPHGGRAHRSLGEQQRRDRYGELERSRRRAHFFFSLFAIFLLMLFALNI